MTHALSTREHLDSLPAVERVEELEGLVVDQFKRPLFLTGCDELDLSTSFFDLGLTSLRLMEIQRSLEAELELTLDTTALFNRPTIEELVLHLDALLGERA
ncbi:acyl carrier protein [Streptomyces iconiensis]|uniref:Acyl carrier protein n=1 Tax=Streptomyces iconiensis TaxID=1384038 RepID=A0ABT7A3B3_9ACTN|nr:acyl carrier protein [Streptomyces iconiensis]MDJ1135790.1 acyl carrier protein [Streptomyces iconiensis]